MSALPLQDQVALVTGGASGIGRSIAEQLLGAGAETFVLDASPRHTAEFLAANPRAGAAVCDVGDPNAVESAFGECLARHGRLDILVNNAGIAGQSGPVEELDVAAWNRCLDVNLSGTFYVTRLAVPHLKTNGGCIVNIASNAGLFGCPNRSPYVASKWAMIGLTKTWAMELGPFNIRVNAVCPTSVEGPRIEAVMEEDARQRGRTRTEIRAVYQRQSSMRTFVTATDVANAVAFLASGLAARISGQVLAVDGNTETLANWLDAG